MKFIGILVMLFFILSCHRSEDRQCLKLNGKETIRRIDLSAFHSLEVGQKLTVNLVQDSLDFIEIIGGEKVLNFIETEVVNLRLNLRNTNKCNYLRSQKHKVKIELHYRNLDSVFLNNSEPVRMINRMKNNTFYAGFIESSGHIFVNVDVQRLMLETRDTWADFELEGTAQEVKFILKGNTFLKAENLQITKKIVVMNWSVGDVHLGIVNDTLKVEIKSKGNVYYSGNPVFLEFTKNGSGQLLKN